MMFKSQIFEVRVRERSFAVEAAHHKRVSSNPFPNEVTDVVLGMHGAF